MSDPILVHRWGAALRFAVGVLIFVLGTSMVPGDGEAADGLTVLAPLIVAAGIYVAASGFGAFLRWNALAVQQREVRETMRRVGAVRAHLPRQLFTLLYAVAEADGRAGQHEREIVRRFLLERFRDPAVAQDLRRWSAEPVPPDQVEGLARGIAAILTPVDREILFAWCCLVAFADQTFSEVEHLTLQAAARGLGLDPLQARRVFHQTRRRVLASRVHEEDPLEEAYATLGLSPGASAEEVRTRHRELVKKFHPDAQSNLGEAAREEATARFREIQRAYELLSQRDRA